MEEKQYEYKGTVTISTEEYRDLITEAVNQKSSASEYRTKYWAEQDKTKSLQEKVDAQKKAIAQYRDFVSADSDRLQAYKLFLADRVEEEI